MIKKERSFLAHFSHEIFLKEKDPSQRLALICRYMYILYVAFQNQTKIPAWAGNFV